MKLRSSHYARLKDRLGGWWSAQDSHILDLIRGASVAGALKALAALLAFGLSVVLGRILGAEAAGVYFLALTTATIAATVGRVGLDSAVLRFVAAHASAGRWADVNRVHRTALAIGFVCSCAVASVLYLSAELLAEKAFSDAALTTPIRVMAASVVPLSLSVLVSRSLLGLSRVRESLLVFSIVPSALALGGTWVLAAEWGVNGAVAAYVLAVIAALVYGWIAWRKATAGQSSARQSRPATSTMRDLLKCGSPLLLGELLQLVIHVSGTVMLGVWSDNADVGQFAVAWRTAALIGFVLVAINTIAQPKFAELYARGEMKSLAATAQKATLIMTACAAPVLIVFLAAPGFVLSAFGSDFSGAIVLLQILSVGQFVNVATGSVGVLLVMSGKELEYRNVQVVAAAVVLLLNVLLIPIYGAVGAAIAVASALIVQNVLFGYFVWVRLGILTLIPRAVVQR